MFEERIAAMNQRTEEAMAANAVQFDKRTYTVDEIQDILGISRTSAYNLVKKKVFHAAVFLCTASGPEDMVPSIMVRRILFRGPGKLSIHRKERNSSRPRWTII